jgi:hypothetical protein
MRNASAKGLTMKATCNNNLPTQTNDVIVNPENPDSKIGCSAYNFHRRLETLSLVWQEMDTFGEYFLRILVLNQDFRDFWISRIIGAYVFVFSAMFI